MPGGSGQPLEVCARLTRQEKRPIARGLPLALVSSSSLRAVTGQLSTAPLVRSRSTTRVARSFVDSCSKNAKPSSSSIGPSQRAFSNWWVTVMSPVMSNSSSGRATCGSRKNGSVVYTRPFSTVLRTAGRSLSASKAAIRCASAKRPCASRANRTATMRGSSASAPADAWVRSTSAAAHSAWSRSAASVADSSAAAVALPSSTSRWRDWSLSRRGPSGSCEPISASIRETRATRSGSVTRSDGEGPLTTQVASPTTETLSAPMKAPAVKAWSSPITMSVGKASPRRCSRLVRNSLSGVSDQ